MSQNYIIVDGELYHYGIKGQKWGVRRYQNKDGSLTELGKRRVKSDGTFKSNKEIRKEISEEHGRLRTKYFDEYGVDKAFQEADEYYNSVYEKKGWVDEDDPKVLSKYNRAEELASKAGNEIRAALRKQYGKDYDDYESHNRRVAVAAATTAVVGSVAAMYGSYALLKAGAKGTVKLGEKIVNAVFNHKPA